MGQFDYLDEERVKLWKKAEELDQKLRELEKRSPESEQETRQHSKKASEYRNKCKDALDKVQIYLQQAEEAYDNVKELHGQIVTSKDLANKHCASFEELVGNAKKHVDETEFRIGSVLETVSQLESIFENHPELSSEVVGFEDALKRGKETEMQINLVAKNLLERKSEIDELYFEIVGYVIPNEESAEATEVEGLKDKLENTYKKLTEEIAKTRKENTEYFQATLDRIENAEVEHRNRFNTQISLWKEEYSDVSKKIASLLPNALTAGLSSAYSSKKSDEVLDYNLASKRFRNGIWGMVAVSAIPFFVSISLIVEGVSLEETLLRMPRLVLAILPLYLPVLWVAYSANKRLNLSKRLIEEYTHKEVRSKTFEGLTKQISDIKDQEISDDLRVRLLYTILEVNSENPGKLISDYNKADHPLMDALEKSVQLSNAVEKLAGVPGLSKISSLLEKKAAKLRAMHSAKVSDGLESLDEESTTEERPAT